MKSIDQKIKSNLLCPKCHNKMQYDKESKVYCKCGYSKGGYDHIHFVTDRLAVGNSTVTLDDTVLDSLGIQLIYNIAIDFPHADKVKLPFTSSGLPDSKDIDINEFQGATIKLVNLLEHYDRILVNCMGGGRRSVAVVCWHLTRNHKQFWKLVKKFQKVRQCVRLSGGIYDNKWFRRETA